MNFHFVQNKIRNRMQPPRTYYFKIRGGNNFEGNRKYGINKCRRKNRRKIKKGKQPQ